MGIPKTVGGQLSKADQSGAFVSPFFKMYEYPLLRTF